MTFPCGLERDCAFFFPRLSAVTFLASPFLDRAAFSHSFITMTMAFPARQLLLLLLVLPATLTHAALPNAEIHVEGGSSFLATFASFGARQTIATDTNSLLLTPPLTVDASLCSDLVDYSTVQWEGDIMLVPRGNCTFERKALAAQQMGASAIIIYNTLESRYQQNETTNQVIYPQNKADYECANGESNITSLTLDPPMYNGSYHDALLTFDSPDNLCVVENPNLCTSRRCLVTGPADNSSGTFQACCAWDIHMTMGIDANLTEPVDIVAVFITMRQADDLLALVALENTLVTIQPRHYARFNASSFILWIMAIAIVWFASWWSVRDYRSSKRKWQLCFQETVARHLQQQEGQTGLVQDGDSGGVLLPEEQEVDALQENNACPNGQEDDLEAPPTHDADTSTLDAPTPREAAALEQLRQQEEPSSLQPPEAEDENLEQQQEQDNRHNTNHHPQALELNAWHAAGFVIVASTVLLVLFYFEIYTWVIVLYGIGCSGALAQLLFAPAYTWIARHVSLFRKCCFAPISNKTCCDLNTMQWVYVFAAISGYLVGAMWLYVGFTDDEPSLNPFYWITQNIMGASVSILFLSVLRLSSIKVATILLVAVFVYDVFFVFITPFLFHGSSVMVTVASGGSGPEASADYCEKYPDDSKCQGGNPLPLLLTIPRINDYRGGSSLLGLGDIVLPGLLIAFGARMDDARRLVKSLTNMEVMVPKHWYNGYLVPLVVAYAVGLLAAMIAVVLMKRGQPALLYIVPACLGTVFVLGRHELGELWRGPQVIQMADRIVGLDPNAASLQVTRPTDEENVGEAEPQAIGTTISGSVRSIS